MTDISNNAAYIIKRINDIWGEKPGKKTLQKMVSLIEQKGVNLGYDYGLHFYGPYSGSLDATTTSLGADGVREKVFCRTYSTLIKELWIFWKAAFQLTVVILRSTTKKRLSRKQC